MLCPNQQWSFLAGNWTKEMIVVHPLTLTGTIIEPQLPHNMSGNTTRIASHIECRKYAIIFLNDAFFSTILFLTCLLRIAANTLFRSLEVMSEAALSNTHRYDNSDATPI